MELPIEISEEEALEALNTFSNDKQTLVMATTDENGEPFVSYSPYVEDSEHNYYIYISAQVQHAHNLNATKKASIMILEDEQVSSHVYGRQRFYFKASVEKFEDNDPRTKEIDELFTKKFHSSSNFMIEKPDFRIYKMIPEDGNLVLNFQSAYKVSKDRSTITRKVLTHDDKHEKNLK